MKRRGFLAAVPAAIGVALLPACGRASLTVAIHPWIGYETFFLAQQFGWLPAEVSLREGASASESLAALKSGAADAACLTLDEVLRVRADGVPLVVVAVLDISAGADVVMVRPEITQLTQLAGKRIAVEASAVGELMLSKLLQTAGLRRADVQVVDRAVDAQLASWRRGEIDAAVTYEPTASQLADAGAVRRFDSRRVPGMILDVLAVRRDRLGAAHSLVRALLASHFRGLEHLRVSRQDAVYRIAARQRVSPEAVFDALAGVVLPDLSRNRVFFAAGSELLHVAAELTELMVERRMLPPAATASGLFDGSCLPQELAS